MINAKKLEMGIEPLFKWRCPCIASFFSNWF